MGLLSQPKTFDGKCHRTVEPHLPVNVCEVLDGDLLLPVGLVHVGLQQVFEVLDGVVPVLVHRAEQLLQTLLHPVAVGRRLVQGVGVALHGLLLALVDADE